MMADGEGAQEQRRRKGRAWPRQADIARAAGVSQATVSMVINDREGAQYAIGDEARQRVWKAVEELSYVTNPAARTLAGGKSYVLGIFTFAPVFPVDFRDFYYPFLLGIEEEAEQQGYDLMLFTSGSGPQRQRRIYHQGANRLRTTDGCILLGRGGDQAELQRLNSEPFPFIFVGRRDLGDKPCPYVGADYSQGIELLVAHLEGQGHHRIAYVGWSDPAEPTIDRRRGYEAALAARNWPQDPALAWQLDDHDITVDLVDDLYQRGATAVLVEDELMAERIWAHVHELGLTVPEDLSIGVLGDPPRGGPSVRDWTSITIPRRSMGQRALQTLIGLIDQDEDAEVPQELLPCVLQVGATSGAAALSP